VIRLTPKNGDAFVNRANIYNGQGKYDRAIQDYDQAIRLNPNDAGAFYNRGISYDSQGKYDRAVQDYDQAIRLDSANPNAIKARGYAQFFAGQFFKSAADFARAAQIEPQDTYIRLWLYVATMRGGANGRDALAAAVPQLDLTFWPGPVVEMFLDRMESAALSQAAGDPKSKERQLPVCDADFFLGEYRLIHGAGSKDAGPGDARSSFQAAVNICPTDSVSLKGAKAELSRLGTTN
jgi:lipoprotein NlpI